MDHSEMDYPAAHSMDSTWFAVDADGHIGVFDTGESGMVPAGLPRYEDGPWEILVETLCTPADSCYIVDRLPPFIAPGMGLDGFNGRLGSLIALFRSGTSPEYVYRQCGDISHAAPKIVRFRDTDVYAIHAFEMNFDGVRKAIKSGTLLGFKTFGGYEEGGRFLACFGLYSYDCREYGYYTPYIRNGHPIHPCRVDELPESARTILTQVVFQQTCFEGNESLIPAKYISCITWGMQAFWQDENGIGHIHQGREDDAGSEFRKTDWTLNIEDYWRFYDALCAAGRPPWKKS